MHPADLDDLSAISKATHFIASIFVGRGVFAKTETTSSLEVARHNAHALETTYRNGRGGMVYAVLPDGRSVLVPASYQPKEREMTEANPMPNFLKRDAQPAAAKPAATKPVAAKPAPKAAAPAKPAGGGKPISRGVLTDKGKKALAKPAKASKAAKAKTAKPKATKAPANDATRAPRGQRAAILAAAQKGTMPTPPDFSANTHKPHRKRLEEVVALAKAGDVKGLKAFEINPTSTSPKAIDRYRNLAVIALEARG